MELTTPRLLLRPWAQEDAETLYAYAKDPRVGPPAGWPPHTGVENSRQIIRTVLSHPETYAVVLRETGEPVGSVGIHRPTLHTGPGEAELGCWLAVPYWGRGIIPEALTALLRRCFSELDCPAVWYCYYDGNDKSRRVAEKCGFRWHHRQLGVSVPALGVCRDEHACRLTREEWIRRDSSSPSDTEAPSPDRR